MGAIFSHLRRRIGPLSSGCIGRARVQGLDGASGVSIRTRKRQCVVSTDRTRGDRSEGRGRDPERSPLGDEVEVGVGMEHRHPRVDRDGSDQAVHEPPDG